MDIAPPCRPEIFSVCTALAMSDVPLVAPSEQTKSHTLTKFEELNNQPSLELFFILLVYRISVN